MTRVITFGLFCCFAGQSLLSQSNNFNTSFLRNSIQHSIDSLQKAPITTKNSTDLGDLFSSIERYRKAATYYQRALELDSTDLNRF